MKILIVEDDLHKLEQISSFIMEVFGDYKIVHAGSYQSAVKKLKEDDFELIVLDMSIPTFDIEADVSSGRPRSFGGRDILLQMKIKKIETKAIVVTQFDSFGPGGSKVNLDTLIKQLQRLYPSTYAGTVYYKASSEDWKKHFEKLFRKALVK